MAAYSFTPRGGSEYFGGGGGWLTGLGQSFGGGMNAGISLTNSLRQMQDANAISPYAVGAAQGALSEHRVNSLAGIHRGMEMLNGYARQGEDYGAEVPQPLTSAEQPPPQFDQLDALARAFGQRAVDNNANVDPMAMTGVSQASRMLGLPAYQFGNPMGHPNDPNNYWGF